MSVSLSKGKAVSLSKAEPGLRKVHIGLGWDTRETDGARFDLDAHAFLLTAKGRVRSDDDFIFYNHLELADGSVVHSPDNVDGEGEGDDEWVKVDLARLPSHVEKIAIAVTIHDAGKRRQSFGMVESAFVRVVNDTTEREVARYDLSEDASTDTAMIFGEIIRQGGEWQFRAVGQSFPGDLAALAQSYGVNIG